MNSTIRAVLVLTILVGAMSLGCADPDPTASVPPSDGSSQPGPEVGVSERSKPALEPAMGELSKNSNETAHAGESERDVVHANGGPPKTDVGSRPTADDAGDADPAVVASKSKGNPATEKAAAEKAASEKTTSKSKKRTRAKKEFKFEFVEASGNEGLKLGDNVPNINGKDIDDIRFQLNDYKGKVIMLDFWGDW